MRKAIPKHIRAKVYEKCNGHCAYCGCELEYKDMQVEHKVPLKRGGADEFENMLPSCRSCNHYKHTLTVEEFRKYLSGIPHRLIRDSVPFNVATRFGLVRHVINEPIFYFETLEKENE